MYNQSCLLAVTWSSGIAVTPTGYDRAAYLSKPNSDISDPNPVKVPTKPPKKPAKRKPARNDTDNETVTVNGDVTVTDLLPPPSKKKKKNKDPLEPPVYIGRRKKRKIDVVLENMTGSDAICQVLDEHYKTPGYKKKCWKTMYQSFVDSSKLDAAISFDQFQNIRFFLWYYSFCYN